VLARLGLLLCAFVATGATGGGAPDLMPTALPCRADPRHPL